MIPQVRAKLFLSGVTASCWRCHRTGPSVIVQSRRNGLVSQNCRSCGAPRFLSSSRLPSLECVPCKKPFEPFKDEGNYAYRCASCRKQFLQWDIVPNWKEFGFPHIGLSV